MRFADSADDNGKLGGGTEKYKTKIVINSSGYCNWMAPAIFESSCDVNTEYFPFDDQVSQAIKNLILGIGYKLRLTCIMKETLKRYLHWTELHYINRERERTSKV